MRGATPNPSGLIGSKRMKALLAELAEQSDIVIIDTPPILAVSDVIPLLEEVSGTVLVARLDSSTRDSVLKARQVIENSRGSILGVVATGVKASGSTRTGTDTATATASRLPGDGLQRLVIQRASPP